MILPRSQQRDEFLASLAHELRNPLAPLRSGIELLLADPERPETDTQLLRMMERQLHQLVRLTDDLIDMSRLERRPTTLDTRSFDLEDMVQRAIDNVRHTIARGRYAFSLTLPDPALTLKGDPERLAQALGNILHNAVKFTPPGGRIEVDAQVDDDLVTIAVRDDGIGIERRHLRDIFDMFTRLDQRTSREQGGLGIGLFLAKRIVDLHGGTLRAESAGLGKGSAFFMRLPLRTPRQRSGAHHLVVDRSSQPRRILLVDDNADARFTLGMMLQRMGHEVAAAESGAVGLELGARFRPDVVLLDIGMPGMDGYETCRRLRQEDWGAPATVIAVTGWGQEEDRRRTREAGFDQHLVKPVDRETLDKTITMAPSLDQLPRKHESHG